MLLYSYRPNAIPSQELEFLSMVKRLSWHDRILRHDPNIRLQIIFLISLSFQSRLKFLDHWLELVLGLHLDVLDGGGLFGVFKYDVFKLLLLGLFVEVHLIEGLFCALDLFFGDEVVVDYAYCSVEQVENEVVLEVLDTFHS